MSETLRGNTARINAKAKPLSAAIARIFKKYRESLIQQVRTGKVELKKISDREFERMLREALVKYGLRHLNSSGKQTANILGGEWILKPTLLRRLIKEKEMQVKILGKSIREAVNEAVRKVLTEAAKQEVAPTAGELARLIEVKVNRVYEIAPQRAMLIARTESIQTEGLAKHETTKGLEREDHKKRKKWLARPNDGRSGKRRHWKMNNVIVDFDKDFVTPLRSRMKYPGDHDAPIEETANCRCNWVIVWEKE